MDPGRRVDPGVAGAELWWWRVDVGAGGGERGPLLTSGELRSFRRALAASSGAGRAGEEGRFRRYSSLRSRSPAVAPSDSAVNGHQPRGPEGASSAGPQAQELRPDVPRVPDASWCFLVDP